jgi:hypothetical protein
MADPATNLNSADGQIMEDDQVFYNVLPPEKADSPLTKSGEISAMPTSATERPSQGKHRSRSGARNSFRIDSTRFHACA